MLFRQLLVVSSCGLITFAASRAEAAPKLAADVDVAVPVDLTMVTTGFGGAVRFGYELHIPLISITPEVGVAYHFFGGTLGPRIFRGFVGGRLGIGEGIRPGVYAHAGFGNVAYGELPTGVPDLNHTSLALDAGVFLDFTLLPYIDLGVHAGYNMVPGPEGGEAAKWVTAGAHIAYVF